MRQSVPVFASQMVEIREILWAWKRKISYRPQSGWFEDTPLKGGPEEGCPLKGVHEGIFLLRLGSMCGTTFELLSSHRGIVCPLAVALRIALGVVVVLEAGLSHKTSSAPPQRRNGRAFSSLTARGGGLPFWVNFDTATPGLVIFLPLPLAAGIRGGPVQVELGQGGGCQPVWSEFPG